MRKGMRQFVGKLMAVVMMMAVVVSMYQPLKTKAADKTFEIQPVTKTPKIDGKVSDGEYGSIAFTVKKGEENIYVYEEKGELADFTADIYLGYDKENIYIAAVAEYAEHKNETLKTGDLWMGDCMQIQISDTLGRNRNELNFSLNSINGNSMMDKPYGVGENSMEAGKDYTVTREGTTTTYEIALNIKQFSTKLDELTGGLQLPFSVAFHQSGGAFIEYCDGIVNKKDIALAGTMTLGGEPADVDSSKNVDGKGNSSANVNTEEDPEGGISPVVIVIPVVVIIAVVAVVLIMKKKKSAK